MDVASSKDLVVSARSTADSQSSLAASPGSRHSNTPHPQDPSRGTAHGRAGDRSRHRSRGRLGCPMAAYIRHAARYTAGAKAQNIARMFNDNYS